MIALASWHEKSDASTVLPALNEPTTSFQHSFILSEHGTAALWGVSHHQQAAAIVNRVADPRAREQLAATLPRAP